MSDTLKNNILRALKARGNKSMRAASLEITDGQNPDLISGMLRHNVQSPRAVTLKPIAEYLGTTVDELLTDDVGSAAETAPAVAKPSPIRGDVIPAAVEMPARQDMARDVPVHGTAAGSTAGAFQFEGGVIDYVRRPPGLVGAAGVYALFVTGDSMAPEHPHGELRFVHPGRPPGPGDSVIVQAQYKEEGPIEAFIKHYVKRDDSRLVTRQINPETDLVFEMRFVSKVHKVLTMNELFGV